MRDCRREPGNLSRTPRVARVPRRSPRPRGHADAAAHSANMRGDEHPHAHPPRPAPGVRPRAVHLHRRAPRQPCARPRVGRGGRARPEPRAARLAQRPGHDPAVRRRRDARHARAQRALPPADAADAAARGAAHRARPGHSDPADRPRRRDPPRVGSRTGSPPNTRASCGRSGSRTARAASLRCWCPAGCTGASASTSRSAAARGTSARARCSSPSRCCCPCWARSASSRWARNSPPTSPIARSSTRTATSTRRRGSRSRGRATRWSRCGSR